MVNGAEAQAITAFAGDSHGLLFLLRCQGKELATTMTIDDPYAISATNKANKAAFRRVSPAAAETPGAAPSNRAFPITIEIPTPGDAKREDDDDDDVTPHTDVSDALSALPRPRDAFRGLGAIIGLIGAAAFVILIALVLARGEPLPRCQDLPDWNASAECL